jgi:hypothetical protein
MKEKFPGFKKAMAMMRKHQAHLSEEGFQCLLPHAAEYVHELMGEFGKEKVHGLQCWILELIAEAKSPDAFDFLANHLRSEDEAFRYYAMRGLNDLGTKEARTLLFEARSWTLATPEETEAFRSELETVRKRGW